MKVAFVHDWLVTDGGSEKVLRALSKLYPGPIYTLFQKGIFPDENVRTSFLQHIPQIAIIYRHLLPLFPFGIRQLDLSGYDLIISSSHCVAKMIRKQPGQIHICYCHTPIRCVWRPEGMGMNTVKKILARPFLGHMKKLDLASLSGVDYFIANSKYIASEIARCYQREAKVIYPPIDTDFFHPVLERKDYFFAASRFVPYKKIDLLVEAFSKMKDRRLLIAGEGPELKKIKVKATKNITFLGHLTRDEYRKYLCHAKGFCHVAQEDFGISMAEAQSAGIPVIAFTSGGAKEIVKPGETGILFMEQRVEALIDAIDQFDYRAFDSAVIRESAMRFDQTHFDREIGKIIQNACSTGRLTSSCRRVENRSL